MSRLHVRDLMTSQVFTVRPSDNLAQVYDLMDAKHVRHVPVVDDEGELQGLVSHRDMVRSALAEASSLPVSNQRDLLASMRVEEVMQMEVETTEPNVPLRDAAQLMLDNKFGCLPVVEGRQLTGILTEADFVRHVGESLDAAAVA